MALAGAAVASPATATAAAERNSRRSALRAVEVRACSGATKAATALLQGDEKNRRQKD